MRLTVAFPLFPADNPQVAEETPFDEPMGLYETPAVTGIYVPPSHGSRLAASEIRAAAILRTSSRAACHEPRNLLLPRLPATALVEF
jgi:hypothetical protein